MDKSVLKRLPTLQDGEQAIARNAREATLLRTLRNALRKKKKVEDVGERLRQRPSTTNESEVSHGS